MPANKSKKGKSSEQKQIEIWWVRLVLVAVFVGLSYAFISLAIDSGDILEWLVGLFFLGWAITTLIRFGRSLVHA